MKLDLKYPHYMPVEIGLVDKGLSTTTAKTEEDSGLIEVLIEEAMADNIIRIRTEEHNKIR